MYIYYFILKDLALLLIILYSLLLTSLMIIIGRDFQASLYHAFLFSAFSTLFRSNIPINMNIVYLINLIGLQLVPVAGVYNIYG